MADQPSPQEDPVADRMNQLMVSRQARHGQFLQAGNNALRARAQLIQEEVAKERFTMQAQRLDLDRLRQLTEITKQTAMVQQQIQHQTHVTNAFMALKDLDPVNDPDYTRKMATIFAENPMATKDPTVQEFTKTQISAMQASQKSKQTLITLQAEEDIRKQSKVDTELALKDPRAATAGAEETARQQARLAAKPAKASPTDAVNDAIVNGKLVKVGMYDADKQKFTGTSDADATHANVEYQNPKSGAYETHNIPIDLYRQTVKDHAARTAATPAPAAAANPADDFTKSLLK